MKSYVPKHNLYRYTCFSESVEELLNPVEDSPVQILACRDFDITPQKFFDEDEGYWIPIQFGKEKEFVEPIPHEAIWQQSADICLILGNTGAGKTTWQLKSVFDCVEENDTELAGYVPVWVDCRLGMREMDADQILKRIATTVGLDVERVRQILQQEIPMLFLMDVNNARSEEQRLALAKALEDFVRKGWNRSGQNRMIIAYRSHTPRARDETEDVFDEAEEVLRNIPGISVWHIQPIAPEQAVEYYQRVKGDLPDHELKRLTDFISQYGEVVETPLLMHLLTFTGFSEDVKTLGQLYQKVVARWLKREKTHWTHLKSSGVKSSTEVASTLLAELAFTLVEKDQLTLTRSECVELLKHLSKGGWLPKQYRIDEEDLINLVNLIRTSNPVENDSPVSTRDQITDILKESAISEQVDLNRILEEIVNKTIIWRRGTDILSFFHDSFAYFFAAYHLRYRQSGDSDFATNVCNTVMKSPYHWMETMRFLGGLDCKEQCDGLLDAFLKE